MLAIYKREMRSYFTTPIGYIFSAIFLCFSAAVFCYSTLYAMSADTTTYFTLMLFSLVILIPLLSMKTFRRYVFIFSFADISNNMILFFLRTSIN